MAGRFKLDENLPQDAERLLGEAGHDVETALSERLGGGPDGKVFDASRSEDRILVTTLPISGLIRLRAIPASGYCGRGPKASATYSAC
jgi:hypothetical protein